MGTRALRRGNLSREGMEGEQVGERHPKKRRTRKSDLQKREKKPSQRALLPSSWSSPRGTRGKLKMKHLIPELRDVTLGIRGLERIPRGNGRVPGVGEPNINSCCPPPKPAREHTSNTPGAMEHQCPLVATILMHLARVVWKILWEGAPA